jgi:hypothetical protein
MQVHIDFSKGINNRFIDSNHKTASNMFTSNEIQVVSRFERLIMIYMRLKKLEHEIATWLEQKGACHSSSELTSLLDCLHQR